MAQYLVQSFKTCALSNRPWSNVYIVEAASLGAATNASDIITAQERAFHRSFVTFTYARVSTMAPNDNVYATNTINQPGSITGGGDWLPLWNTVRVDFTVNGGGRPSRKLYRLPLDEGDQSSGTVAVGVRSGVDTALAEMIDLLTAASTPLVDPDGQALIAPFVMAAVQMRQLHRKRRRAVTP